MHSKTNIFLQAFPGKLGVIKGLIPHYYLPVCVAAKCSCLLMECQDLHLKRRLAKFCTKKNSLVLKKYYTFNLGKKAPKKCLLLHSTLKCTL